MNTSFQDFVHESIIGSPYFLYAALTLVSVLLIDYAIKYRKEGSKLGPPLVPYILPWIGSALAIGKEPDAFFKRAISAYGPVFSVKVMGREMVYIASPDVIRAVYRNANTFDFTPFKLELCHRIFRLSRKATYSPFVRDYAHGMHHRGLLPKNIVGLLERYNVCSLEEIKKAVEQFDNKTTPLKSFLLLPAYCSTARTFFGRSFDAIQSYGYFRKFDDLFHLIAAGLPHFMLPGPYRAWKTIVSMFEDYLQNSHEECCEFFLEIESASRDAGWSNHDIAKLFSMDLWAMQSNTIWVGYWVIVYALQDPQRLARLVAEVDNSRKEWQAANPDESPDENTDRWISSAALPFLTSMIYETLRLSTSVFSIRRVTKPVVLGGYQLKTNQRVFCATRAVHLDDGIHQKAEEFNADRYMGDRKTLMKNGVVVPNHTMPFGGGVSMCEGRHFAMGSLKTFLVLLLSYATIELDTESPEMPTFYKERIGVGIMPAVGDMNIRIRRRTMT